MAADATPWDSPTSSMSVDVRRARLQKETLKELKQSLVVAAESGTWTHRPDSIRPDSFKFWANETVNAIDEMLTAAKASERAAETQSVQKIASSVVGFLAKTVAASPCYPALCDFAGILTRAMPLAGEELEPQK